jgi:RES domain-containing protein
LFGGRWSSAGTRIAYTAEHLSLAMVEYFVHIDAGDPPKDLVVVAADIPDSVSRVFVRLEKLPIDWRQVPAPPALAAIGDAFAAERKSAILVLPSAVVPSEANWLINPLHPEFAQIQVRPAEPFQYDARFFT